MGYNVSATDSAILTIIRIPAMIAYAAAVFYDSFSRNIRYVKNWPDVYMISFGKIKSATIYFRDETVFELSKKNYLSYQTMIIMRATRNKYGRNMDIKKRGDIYEFRLNGKKVLSKEGNSAAFAGEMLNDIRRKIDAKGKDVVDVGAYAGDTALYYAIMGKARHVYAFEPVPEHYEDALDNVKLNGMEDKVTMFNEAVGARTETVKIDNEKKSESFNEQVEKEIGVSVMKMRSLSDVVKRFNINDGVLKMDIEGGEYEIFKKTPEKIFKKFSAMHIEYHYGYKDIVEKLQEMGYNVWYSRPSFSFRMFVGVPKIVGDIIAVRK